MTYSSFARCILGLTLVGCASLVACSDSSGPDGPGEPADIAVSAGDGQAAVVGQALGAPIAVRVTDDAGRVVPDAPVQFVVTGSGSVTPGSTRTNANGIAFASWTMGTSTAGTPRATARLLDDDGTVIDSVSFTALLSAGAAAGIDPSGSQFAGDTVGQTLGSALTVVARDEYGNVVPGAIVAWNVVQGPATITTATTTSDAQGVAENRPTLGTTAGLAIVRARLMSASAGGTALDSVFFQVEALPAAPATLSADVALVRTASTNAPMGEPTRVIVRDGFGNLVPGASVQFTITGGSAVVSPATATSNDLGQASTTVAIGSGTDTVRVRASLPGLATAASRVDFLVAPVLLGERFATLQIQGFGIDRVGGDLLVAGSGQLVRLPIAAPTQQLSISIGSNALIVNANSAGTEAYVTRQNGPMAIVNLATNTRVTEVTIPATGSHYLGVAPRDNRVYVTSPDAGVYAVDVATRTVVATIPASPNPWGTAFRTVGADSLLYVSSRNGAAIFEIDMRTNSLVRQVALPAGARPHGLAISPDGTTLYAADDALGVVHRIALAAGTRTQLALAGAFGLAMTPDGQTVYATTNTGVLAVISTSTFTVSRTWTAGGQPREIVTSESGDRAWAANGFAIDVIYR